MSFMLYTCLILFNSRNFSEENEKGAGEPGSILKEDLGAHLGLLDGQVRPFWGEYLKVKIRVTQPEPDS